MSPSFSLANKVAIVTGASRWTGKAIALELAKAGADVVVTARTAEGIEKAASEIRSLGRRSLAIPTDVRVTEQVDNMVKRTLAEFHRVDILVNNVGASFIAPALKLTEGGWDAMVRENLKPAFICSKAVVPAMMEQGGGSIINIASGEGLRAAPTNPAYGAAKAGVINLTMTLAVEWAPYRIRVNAVAPGFIDTPALPQALAGFPDLQETYNRVPLKRAGKLEEIAAPVVFLASDAAGYVTGALITVDGGLTCRM
jgi:NAD(P)-dependent dehydrogenase (short-subunit alcohol dehydrogenase family)